MSNLDALAERLLQLGNKIEIESKAIYESFTGDMNNDLNYLCLCFLHRQLNFLSGINKLQKDNNIILLSRSMFEGALYLSLAIKYPEYAKRWRLYSFVIDMQRIESGDEPPEEIRNMINSQKDEVDQLFLKTKKNGDQFYQNKWVDKTIKSLAEEVDQTFLRLYKQYYSPMSDFHHFGTKSFGIRYSCEQNKIASLNNDETKLEIINALSLGFSSVFSTLKLCSTTLISTPEIKNIIKNLEDDFKGIEGMIATEVIIR